MKHANYLQRTTLRNNCFGLFEIWISHTKISLFIIIEKWTINTIHKTNSF